MRVSMKKKNVHFSDEELNKLLERFKSIKDSVDKSISEVLEAAKVIESRELKKEKSNFDKKELALEKTR